MVRTIEAATFLSNFSLSQLLSCTGFGQMAVIRSTRSSGALAQLVERLVRNEKVRSSNLLCSTSFVEQKTAGGLPAVLVGFVEKQLKNSGEGAFFFFFVATATLFALVSEGAFFFFFVATATLFALVSEGAFFFFFVATATLFALVSEGAFFFVFLRLAVFFALSAIGESRFVFRFLAFVAIGALVVFALVAIAFAARGEDGFFFLSLSHLPFSQPSAKESGATINDAHRALRNNFMMLWWCWIGDSVGYVARVSELRQWKIFEKFPHPSKKTDRIIRSCQKPRELALHGAPGIRKPSTYTSGGTVIRSMKPTLLVLAAGMGSRYGGLKQMDPMGPNGETVLDYSVYDAIRAGFGRVVFIIREDFAEAFKQGVGARFADRIQVDYVFQKLDDLPGGFQRARRPHQTVGHRPRRARRPPCGEGALRRHQCRRFLRPGRLPPRRRVFRQPARQHHQ